MERTRCFWQGFATWDGGTGCWTWERERAFCLCCSLQKIPEAPMAVELQTAAADLARRNMELNGICCDVVTGDMREAYKMFSGVTAVVCNPPYDKVGSGKAADERGVGNCKARGSDYSIREVCEAAGRVLGTGGRLYTGHTGRRGRLPT